MKCPLLEDVHASNHVTIHSKQLIGGRSVVLSLALTDTIAHGGRAGAGEGGGRAGEGSRGRGGGQSRGGAGAGEKSDLRDEMRTHAALNIKNQKRNSLLEGLDS
jgi:uncharacterized membrane protein